MKIYWGRHGSWHFGETSTVLIFGVAADDARSRGTGELMLFFLHVHTLTQASYVDPATRLRYVNADEYQRIEHLSNDTIIGFLLLRKEETARR